MTKSGPIVVPVSGAQFADYAVTIGRGLTQTISDSVPGDSRKVLIVHPPVLHARAEHLREALSSGSREVFLAEVPDGESAKRIEVASFVWGLLGQLEFSRTDAIVGFGGERSLIWPALSLRPGSGGFQSFTFPRRFWGWWTPLSAVKPELTRQKERISSALSTLRARC